MFRDLQNYIPGKTFVTADDMNELRKIAQFLNNLFGQNALADAAGFAFRKPPIVHEFLWARITDIYEDGYPWVEVKANADGTFDDVDNGRNSDDNGVGYESNGSTDDLTDQIVLLRRGVAADDGTRTWHFSATPTPLSSSNMTLVAVTGTNAGIGNYQGNRDAIDLGSVTVSADVTALVGGGATNTASGTNSIILNPADKDFPGGHMIDPAGSKNVRFVAFLVGENPDGKEVFVMTGAQFKVGCQPAP